MVIVEEATADRGGIASSWRCLNFRNRTKKFFAQTAFRRRCGELCLCNECGSRMGTSYTVKLNGCRSHCTVRVASCLLQSWLTWCAKSRDPELSTGRAIKIQRCQGQTGSRESGIIRQGCPGKRVPRDDAANGCDSQAARRRSYRLSLLLIDIYRLPPLETSVPRLARALLVQSYIYI